MASCSTEKQLPNTKANAKRVPEGGKTILCALQVAVLNGILCAMAIQTAEMGLMRMTVKMKILNAPVAICSPSQGLKKQHEGE